MPVRRNHSHNLNILPGGKSRKQQALLLERVTKLFFVTHKQQSPQDRMYFGNLFHRTCMDSDTQVLVDLSIRLARQQSVPEEIIGRLLVDEYDVAAPLLKYSNSISDEMLIEVIDSSISTYHNELIAKRSNLSSAVSDILLAESDDATIFELSQNHSASFSDEGMELLIELATHNGDLRDSLLRRQDITRKDVDKLIEGLDEKLRKKLVRLHPQLSKNKLRIVSQTKVSAMVENYQPLSDSLLPEARRKIEEDFENGKVSQYYVTKLAQQKLIHETIYAFSLLAEIEAKIVCHIVFNAELPALIVLVKSQGFSRDGFQALLSLRGRSRKVAGSIVSASLRRYDQMIRKESEPVLEFLIRRFSNEHSKNCLSFDEKERKK